MYEETTEEEEEEEEEEDKQSPSETDTQPASPQPQQQTAPKGVKHRKSNPCIILPDATERLLGEWLEFEVQFIYDKKCVQHKDKERIKRAFEEKARTLEPLPDWRPVGRHGTTAHPILV